MQRNRPTEADVTFLMPPRFPRLYMMSHSGANQQILFLSRCSGSGCQLWTGDLSFRDDTWLVYDHKQHQLLNSAGFSKLYRCNLTQRWMGLLVCYNTTAIILRALQF